MAEGEDLVRRLKRLELVHAVSRELHNSLDAASLLPRVLGVVLDSVGAEAGSIWLLRGDKIVCEHAFGGAGESIVGLELPRGAGVVGSVAEKRAAEVVLDAQQDRRFIKQVDEATGFVTRSTITVPLVVRGECLGSLQILNKKAAPGRFTKEDAEVIQEIALDAATVLRNATLLKAEKRAAALRALLRMSREITSTLDLDRILTTAVNILSGIVAFDRCVLALPRGGSLQVAAVSGKEKPDRGDPALQAVETLLGALKDVPGTVWSPTPEAFAEEDPPRAERFRRHAEATGMKAVLVVPLKDDSGFIGMLSMEAAREEFVEEDQTELIETFANQVAVALRNADLYRHTPLVGFLQGRGGGGLEGGRPGLLGRPWVRRSLAAAGVLLLLGLVPLRVNAPGDGEVIPSRRHHLRTDTSLVVDRIDVEEGQAVEAGQVLGALRSEDLEIRMAETESKVRSARADAARHEAAGRSGEARAAQEQIRWHEAQRDLLARRLEACVLRSPARGFVLTRRPRDLVGGTAEAGKSVLEIAEAGSWSVEIHVSQEWMPSLAPGQAASFRTPAHPGRRFEGKVVAVGVAATETPRGPAFPVTFTVEDPGDLLRAGMRGAGAVSLGTRLAGLQALGPVGRWFRNLFGI